MSEVAVMKDAAAVDHKDSDAELIAKCVERRKS
jgi:hypothetical protein